MSKTKIEKITLIDNNYIRSKFKSVKCHPLKVPDITIKCEMELDTNSDGAAVLVEDARKRVKKYVDDRVGIVADELPKMARKVNEITLKFFQKAPKPKNDSERDKLLAQLDKVHTMEVKAHNTMITNAMKGIESGVPGQIELARKAVAKRHKATKNLKIKTVVKVSIITGLTLVVTGIGIAAAVGITFATAGVAAGIFAIVGAGIAGLATAAGVAIGLSAVIAKAGGSADQALADLKKSMQAVKDHKKFVLMSKHSGNDLKTEWSKLQTAFTPAFIKLETKLDNYDAHVQKVLESSSKASKSINALFDQIAKLDKEIKKSDGSKDRDAEELKDLRDLLQEDVDASLELIEKNQKVFDSYRKEVKKIKKIVGGYRNDTPPNLQVAYTMLGKIAEITPSATEFIRHFKAIGKTTGDMGKLVKKK